MFACPQIQDRRQTRLRRPAEIFARTNVQYTRKRGGKKITNKYRKNRVLGHVSVAGATI